MFFGAEKYINKARSYSIMPNLPHINHNTPYLWQEHLPKEYATNHKYGRGHTLVICGDYIIGATRLAAMAARRIGSGLVTAAGPAHTKALLQADAPGMLFYEITGTNNLKEFCTTREVSSIIIGPGLGQGDVQRELLLAAINCNLPIVLDADALTIFEEDSAIFLEALHDKCVLTPHHGEFTRLFKDIPTDSKTMAIYQASTITGCVVLYKGSNTFIATPEELIHNNNAPPFLATAGSGDVLSGVIGGLMAKGMAPNYAACAGAWIHGKAGETLGFGLIAEDLPLACAKELAPFITIS